MLARRIEAYGSEEERGGGKEINGVPLLLQALKRKHQEGSRLVKVYRFSKKWIRAKSSWPKVSVGLWFQTLVRLFSGSVKHSTSLKHNNKMSADQMTFVLYFLIAVSCGEYNHQQILSTILDTVFKTIFDSFLHQCMLHLLIMFPLTISIGPTLVLPCLLWNKPGLSPQGYTAQRRDLDLLTSRNTDQQSFLYKLAQSGKESFGADSFAER